MASGSLVGRNVMLFPDVTNSVNQWFLCMLLVGAGQACGGNVSVIIFFLQVVFFF